MSERFKVLSGPPDSVEKQLNEFAEKGYRPIPGSLAKEPHGGPLTLLLERVHPTREELTALAGFLRPIGDAPRLQTGSMHGVDDSKVTLPPVHEEPPADLPLGGEPGPVDPDVVKALGGKNEEGAANVKEPKLDPAVGDKDASPHGKAHSAGKHVGHDKGSVVGQKKK